MHERERSTARVSPPPRLAASPDRRGGCIYPRKPTQGLQCTLSHLAFGAQRRDAGVRLRISLAARADWKRRTRAETRRFRSIAGSLVLLLSPIPVLAAGAGGIHGAAVKSDPADLLFASPTRLDHIGRVVAPVMIDGQGPFRFVVDTGANHCTLSPPLAKLLRLTPTPGAYMRVSGVTGTQQLPYVTVSRLQAGDLIIKQLQMPVVETSVMAGADGILGTAGLTDDRIIVDFQNNRVTISRSHGLSAVLNFLAVPARRVAGGVIMVPAQIGRVPVAAIIDTGSSHTLGNLALQRALLADDTRDGKVTNVYGVTKDIAPGELVNSPEIALGPARISHLPVVYGEFNIFKVWNLQSKPAVIVGMDALGTVDSLIIDFAQAKVYLLPVQPPGVTITNSMSFVPRRFPPRA